jgi:ParB-like chromosome segregation protein Spo0J
MTATEFDALKSDIAENGLLQAIVVYDGMILDGGNRYRACVELGLEPQTVEIDFTEHDIVSYVLSCNLHRRHLSPGQMAAIVASAQDWANAQIAGSNQYIPRADAPATLPDQKLSTVADRAAQSGASERTQRMADKVAREDPDLAKRVAQGDVSLPAALKQVEQKTPTIREQKATGEHESAAELAARTDAVAVKPSSRTDAVEDSSKQRPSPGEDATASELNEARGNAADLAVELQLANAELESYRAGELGDGEAKLFEANKRVIKLEGEIRRLEMIRDGLMNDNAELKKQIKRLQRQLERGHA